MLYGDRLRKNLQPRLSHRVSSTCLERDNPVQPDTFANISVEIECAGRGARRISCCSGNIYNLQHFLAES